MKILEPHLTTRHKRGKLYKRWEVQTGVEIPTKHVLLEWGEWLRLLEMADRYLALLSIVKNYYYEKKYSYEFLRSWLADELRHLEKYAKSLEEKGFMKEAELVRFRIKVWTEELRQKEQEYRRIEKILKEQGII